MLFHTNNFSLISGAPRLLQCIAQDEVVPELKRFRKLTKRNEPFHGYVRAS